MRRLLKFDEEARARARSQAEDHLRALAEHAPRAEAIAASWIERLRPFGERVYVRRRTIATVAISVVTLSFFVHVMLGANGMVVYKQKRSEYQALQKKLAEIDQENQRYTQQIEGLKSNQKAIEKEAREQLGYVKPGEYKYVPANPEPQPAAPPANHSAKK